MSSGKPSRNITPLVFVFFLFVSFSKEVQVPAEASSPSAKSTISSKSTDLNVCLRPDRPSKDLAACFGHQVLRKLQDLEEKEEFNLVDGISLQRDESGPRDISNYLDKNPMDFRSIVEGASSLVSRRAMQWDLGILQPGLVMRIGPTLSAAGVLEFVMDPRVRDRDNLDSQDPSTARLITRQLLVPFLLGFKFQLSTLMPILFGLLVIVSKKALILAKLAVLASSVFGYNSLFGGTGGGWGGGHGGGYYGGHTGPGLSAYGNRHNNNDHYLKNSDLYSHGGDENVDPYYGSSSNTQQSSNGGGSGGGYPTGHVTSPEDLRDRLEQLFVSRHGHDRASHGARNFAWNE